MRFRACFLKYNILFCILQQKTVRISLIFCVFHIYKPPSALCVPDFPVFFITLLTAEISKTGRNITAHNTAVTKISVALFKSDTQSSRPLFTAHNRIATYTASHTYDYGEYYKKLFIYFVNSSPLKAPKFIKIRKLEFCFSFVGEFLIFNRGKEKFNNVIFVEQITYNFSDCFKY